MYKDFCIALTIFALLQMVRYRTKLLTRGNIFAKISCSSFFLLIIVLILFNFIPNMWILNGNPPNWVSSIYIQTISMWFCVWAFYIGLITSPGLIMPIVAFVVKKIKRFLTT
jgi:hypothetical protein